MPRARGIPGAIIGAAVVMFVYGGLLLLCVTCSGGALAMNPPDQIGLQAALDKDAPGHKIVQFAGLGFSFVFAITFIGAGFGVLWRSNIARFIAMAACVAIVFETIATTGYQAFIVSPVTEKIMADHMLKAPPGQKPPIDMGAVMVGGRIVGVLIAISIPLLFCTPILILLNVKSAREAFANKPMDEPEEAPSSSRYRGYDDDDDYRPPSREPKFPGDTGIQE